MEHSQSIQYWKSMAHDKPDEKTIKVNPQNDHTAIDADFIMQYADENSEILDLASGTGLTINKYYEKVGHIDAVEMFPEFSKFIVQSPKVSVFNENVTEFDTDKNYDDILMFGIVSYFNELEVRDLYLKYKKYLKPQGKLIIKNQFGVNDDVSVSGVSKELKKPYYSEYRHLNKEIGILKSVGLKAIEAIDIYPPEANRWDNTHFYAIVASSNEAEQI